MTYPKILSVGTAVPDHKFTQKEIASILGVSDEKGMRFFDHEHVKTRHLILPKNMTSEDFFEETPAQLREKFLNNAIVLIEMALDAALTKSGLQRSDVDFITCVTSTSFIVPGLSAHVLEKLKLKKSTQRLDIVGMGCNAGLNGLNAVSNWCSAHPEKTGVLICCELCSCIYSIENSENAALVNSLFGDGVAVSIVGCKESKSEKFSASLVDYQGHVIADSLSLLRFDWNDEKNRYSFFVDKKTPETLCREIEWPLQEILKRNQLKISDINHWIVHSGGAAILDSLEKKLGLDKSSFRHTRTVLENYGNISSGSFLFSYQKLLSENKIKAGDRGLMITMGPGLTIEMALLSFLAF